MIMLLNKFAFLMKTNPDDALQIKTIFAALNAIFLITRISKNLKRNTRH